MASYSIADLDHRLRPSALMPVMFVGHGNPMHAISDNAYTRTWHQLGQQLPEAQAIVVISAHWLTPGRTHITDAPKNPIIYDFGGFPDELFRAQYESVGDTDVARLLARQLVEYEAQLDQQWGLDHGTWSVLKHLAPEPGVPILQISIDYTMPLPQLYQLYGRLRAMRRRGVVFIGSGNIVHALGRVKWDGGTAWDPTAPGPRPASPCPPTITTGRWSPPSACSRTTRTSRSSTARSTWARSACARSSARDRLVRAGTLVT
jgi:4,5-DOPA dioxygenase extradiol